MPYYHVITKTAEEDKYKCLFSELVSHGFKRALHKPYERGNAFFSGNDLFYPANLRSVQIIRTERPDQDERDEINRKDRERIDEINRSGDLVFISPGSGYDAEDIAEAGEDVTHSFIKGPPGFKAGRFVFSAKIFSWITGVLAAVVGAGIAKWLGRV